MPSGRGSPSTLTTRAARPPGAPLRSTGVGLAVLAVLAALPVVFWRPVLRDALAGFHWSLGYVASQLSPWLLLLAGLAFLVPVALSGGRSPESRLYLYPGKFRAYLAWGTVLYLLGLALALQVAQLWGYSH